MVLPMAVTVAGASGNSGAGSVYTAAPVKSDYFYKQLDPRAQAIYTKLLSEYTGTDKATYYTGTKMIDLMGVGGIDDDVVLDYKAGNKDLFNDFAAAKDALDLDHPELWWLDSGYLTFRVTKDTKGYHVLIGPGRGDTYLLAGKKDINHGDKGVAAMDKAITEKIDGIVAKARTEAAAANKSGAYTEADKAAALVRSVHDQIVYGLSYRYETDCTGNEGLYIRTIYAMETKKGVCEAYARTLQLCLSKLGIECVVIHGLQTKGTPEDHMWNAVKIDGKWYAVDATWDDPVSADYQGVRDVSTLGEDKKENTNYLLVGQNIIGEYWRPSGYVSTGSFEFTYPTIETSSFNGDTAYGSSDGLRVDYSAGRGSMEDGTPAGVFTVTFQGLNMTKAAEDKGLYFMLKMYDYHPDGTVDAMGEWYYAAATEILIGDNDYFKDTNDGLQVYTSTCEYIEVAVTTRAPEGYAQWTTDPKTSYLSQHPLAGYFHGTEDEIIAQSGMLYNSEASYEAPPYVFKQTPIPNAQATAGYEYRFDVTWDDELYHPTAGTVTATEGNVVQAAAEQVRVSYVTVQDNLHDPNGPDLYVDLTGEVPFDKDRDGYVDMDPAKNSYVNFKWHYVHAEDPSKCPNAKGSAGHVCDVSKGCRIDGVSFNFRASDMWQDDITEYRFELEGVVGSRSGKYPNSFGVVAAVPGLCPACYRSQGIDWNLWGKPTLLDAPENLDLEKMAKAGGTDEATLKELEAEMNTSGLNGRLMLVVEDKSQGAGNREEYEKINGYLEDEKNLGQVLGSSVFEINFNRICPAVKLKPGDSLRVQVGYPAGVTYEDFMDGEVELKAYHFTRCDEDHQTCGNVGKVGHKWGDDIVSVEEITMIPTPYGMVIMCDAFSPFEIVATKKSGSAPVSKDYTVVVVESANGAVKVDGAEALGKAGNVKLTDGQSKKITVTPDQGYAVDTVALGGVALKANADGTYTLKGGDNVKQNDVLSVTFVPESVKTAGSETLVSTGCAHTHTKANPADSGKARRATCTENGYEAGTVCADCGTLITQGHVLHATGHNYVNGKCSVCGSAAPESHRPSDVFTDLPKDGYEREAVDYSLRQGLMFGVDPNVFSPYTFTTRGQVMTILARLDGVDTGSGADWDKKGIQWAIQKGLTSDPSSNPTMPREELMFMLWVSVGKPAADVSVLAKFADGVQVPALYAQAMAWAVEHNIMAGVNTGDGKIWLQPDSPTQRVMFAAFIMRAKENH